MFSDFKRIFGSIDVKEKDEYIIVEGLTADSIASDIQRIWKTSKINKYMFSTMGRSKVVFPKFFAIEFIYALKTIQQQSRQVTSRRAVDRIIELLYEHTWLATTRESASVASIVNVSRLSAFNTKMLDHQLEFIEQYGNLVPRYNLNGYYLAAAAGTGKTLSGLGLFECLEQDILFVVCPKNAVTNVWVDNVESFYKRPQKVWHSLSGEPIHPNARIYVAHYERIADLLTILPRLRNKNIMIDLDEGHNFNDIGSNRTQAFLQLCKESNSKHVVWASGTPLKSIGKEAIPFIQSIDPLMTPKVIERFKAVFGMSTGRAGDILSNRMGIITYKVDKKLVVEGQPIEETIRVKIPDGNQYTLKSIRVEMINFIRERVEHYRREYPRYERIYDETMRFHENTLRTEQDQSTYRRYRDTVRILMRNRDYRHLTEEMKFCNDYEKQTIIPKLPNEMKGPFRDAKSVIKYIPLKVRGEALGRILGKRRAQCHVDMVKYCGIPEIVRDAKKKTIIFTNFVEVVDEVADYMTQEGFKPLKVYGKTNSELPSIIRMFEKDDSLDPLAATMKSLSTAVPMIMANTIVFMDQPFRDSERVQAVARAHRKGQDSQVYVYTMLLDTGDEPNVSTRSNEIMEWSREQVDLIMGTTTTSSVESFVDGFTYFPTDDLPISTTW